MGIYRWQLWRPDRLPASTNKVAVDPDDVTKPQPGDAIKGIVNVAGEMVRLCLGALRSWEMLRRACSMCGERAATRKTLPLPCAARAQWELHVWKDDWGPDWKVPLIITVVIVSLVVGVLLFAVLLSW